MDEIIQRLNETSAQCLTTLEQWLKDKKDKKSHEALQDSVHELRKVASRIEIEMALSERDSMTQKPIPIPSHRDSRRKTGKGSDNSYKATGGNGGGNGNDGNGQDAPAPQEKPIRTRARRTPRKTEGGEG